MRALALFSLSAALLCAADERAFNTWSEYLGGADSSQYTSLKQVNKNTVKQLEMAWSYPAGMGNRTFNPIIANGVMYVLAKNNSIVALDAATGKEIWTHAAEPGTTIITDRGINYWESKDRKERQLLFASNHCLRAIDARTGASIPSFGDGGVVDRT